MRQYSTVAAPQVALLDYRVACYGRRQRDEAAMRRLSPREKTMVSSAVLAVCQHMETELSSSPFQPCSPQAKDKERSSQLSIRTKHGRQRTAIYKISGKYDSRGAAVPRGVVYKLRSNSNLRPPTAISTTSTPTSAMVASKRQPKR
ncbi:hypothetical protein CBR_g29714 [Chara braunii]|uniref:Uncharacterized protein n=1 Tax=Chara braunii TaxID=69332 RepID=A0A388LB63_CHABU|nr:hypothetical protein CBR_g29714 [Chara braunii]|eukprot:GBG79567.1 hypothetical protein CBR_g29714 [Chara braunii]